jgi:hypothetical protein
MVRRVDLHMSPANAAVRFGLELGALVGVAALGWQLGGVVVAVLLVAVAAAAWATFRVPGDPGDAPVAVRGIVRLFLEIDVFTVATIGMALAWGAAVAVPFAVVVVVHYATTTERVRWLLSR